MTHMLLRAHLFPRPLAISAIGAGIGVLAWPNAIWLAPLPLLLLPLLTKRHWLSPFLLMLGYHLATTYGLIYGTAVFFPHAGLFLGMGFWALSSLAFALPYLAYSRIASLFKCGGLGAVAATIITSAVSTVLPPLGVIGWTSPWIGVLPEGWLGIFLMVWMIYALGRWADNEFVDDPDRVGRRTLFVVSVGVFFCFVLPPSQTVPAGWVGINTNLGRLRSDLSYVGASMKLAPKVLGDLHAGDRVVLLPETVAGPWLPGTRAIWRPVIQYTVKHPGQTVLLGAAVPNGKGYLDALVAIQNGHQTILPDHIPVPFSMWHPWRPRESFRMAPFSGKPETTEIAGKKAGYLICYEQLLIWPALDLYPQGIQILLAPANDWWARGTDIPAIQRASAKAWGAFFGVPVLFAVNR